MRPSPPATRRVLAAPLPLLVLACGGGTEPTPASTRSLLEQEIWGVGKAAVQDVGAGTIQLGAGHGVGWWATYADPSHLRFVGEAGSPGELVLSSRAVDFATGMATGDELRLANDLEAGPFEWHVPLVDCRDGYVTITVGWNTAAGFPEDTLTLTTLDVEEPVERALPPIVFVSLDTLSARHTSVHGYPRRTTPTLEALAAEGVTFEQAISNAPWTGQSYYSQLTGLPAEVFSYETDEHGKVPDEVWVLPRRAWTLAELLRAAGYRTAGFVDSPWLLETRGTAQGFEHFDDSAGRRPIRDTDGGIRHQVPRALAWLDGLEGDAPPFLFLHAKDVHGPYLPTAPYDGAFAEDAHVDRAHTLRLGPSGETYGHVPPYVHDYSHPELGPGSEVRSASILDAYDEGILEVDALVGELFDALRARGLLEDALVIVSADHGESTLAHELHFVHGIHYQDVLHVPLIVRLPGAEGAGTRIADPVQLMDLYPTIAELLGVTLPRDAVQGRSLLPRLRGGALPPAPLVSSGKNFGARSVTQDGWKLVVLDLTQAPERPILTHPRVRAWLAEHHPAVAAQAERGLLRGDRPGDAGQRALVELAREALGDHLVELYFLPDDPGEARDLAAQEPDRVAALLELLEVDDERSARTRAMLAVDAEPGAVMTDAERAELEALGYADGEED